MPGRAVSSSLSTAPGTVGRRAATRLIYVPFKDGQPAGAPVDVLTGFLNADEKAQGRPVGVAIDKAGALLVTDDVGNAVWRVTGAAASN